MPLHSKLVHRFNAVLFKIPVRYIGKYTQDYSKMHMERQRNYKDQAMLKKRNKVGGNSLPDVSAYQVATVFKTMQENYLVVQWLRLYASNTVGTSLIPGQGTKILYATKK